MMVIKRKTLVRRNRVKEERARSKVENKMEGNTQLVIITVNVNGINLPIKWKWIVEWIEKQYVSHKKHI